MKNILERGGTGKLRSFWEDKIYIVDSRNGLDNYVYEVHPESDPNCERVLHRNLILPCPFSPYEATPVTTKPSVVVKRENRKRRSSLKIGLHCQCLNLKFLKMICLASSIHSWIKSVNNLCSKEQTWQTS